MDQKHWNTPEKDFLFDAEWEYIKPKRSPIFGDCNHLEAILKVNKALDDIERGFKCK